jgi:hypothetical protein
MLAWKEVSKVEPRGVLVGTNAKQEWILPWWWENYIRHNSLPVTFVDLGLSEEGKAFCRERGNLSVIPSFDFLGDREKTKEERAEFWETIYEGRSWWHKRGVWHHKPIALLQTPYENTLWLDADCEVHADLSFLFDQVMHHKKLLLCPEPEEAQEFDREKGHLFPDEILFNSGVIGYARGSDHILKWAEKTLVEHGEHWGDQNLLSRLIYEENWPVQILDREYNWRALAHGKNPDAKITHWVGEAGKFFISLKQMRFL